MPADYLFINATDATIADITAATATTAAVAARSVSAASATSADAASYLDAATEARAILPTAATAAQKKAIAYTLLLSAGVVLGDELSTVAKLADAEQRNKFRLKGGRQEAVNLFEAIS